MDQQRPASVRVLFLDHVSRMSGAEQSLADLVVGLAQGPIDPVVCLPSDGPLAAQLRANGVLVRMVPMSKRLLETSRTSLANPFVAIARLGAFIVANVRIWRLIREVRPRLVHTNTLKTHLLAVIPCAVARVPLVWHVRDILGTGWLRKAFVWCGRFANAIIVPSRAVAEPFKANRAIYRKLRLIPNGIRVEDFTDARNDRSLREAMDVAPSDPVIGIVGRIAPWKGQDVFLRAAAMLALRYPRAHFAIVGAVLFPENDIPFERHLHRMVAEYGLQDRVTFLGWQPAPEAMAAIDIFVHASAEPEPFGRAIVEAMAAGKPVVAAAGGAVTEILPPSAGFIVPPSRPELLADALDRLLSDRKLRKRMGEAGTAIADSFFPVARTVQSVAQLYRAVAATSKRRGAGRRRMLRTRKPAVRKPQVKQPRPVEQPMSRPATPAPERRTPELGRPYMPYQPEPVAKGRRNRKPVAPEPVRWEPPAPVRAAVSVAAPRFEGIEPLDDFDEEPVMVRPTPRPVAGAQVAAATLPAPGLLRQRQIAVPDTLRSKPLYDAIKRVIDLSVALTVLLVGLPLWLTVAVLIKLESRGPVFHRGIVYGKDCVAFRYYKFRSMRIDGDDKAHRKFIERYVRENGGHELEGETVYKLMGDDRVTAVGRWIRKFSIDEIPQLWNVLSGQMSLVGPRPPLDYEFELYDEHMKQRLIVRPGITGMQQVWHRHTASFEDRLRMDLSYIRQRSTWLDIKLMLHTIPAALRGH
jgi:lipopolysaccharide/colanic/teichoic acid biosynthesis glycosyltransferase/glycosyltransferase involved in cell wall biosynthesis